MATITSSAGSSHVLTTPEEFAAYTSQRIADVNRLVGSSAVSPISIPNVGEIHNRPYVNSPTGAANLSSATGSAATAGNITADNIRFWVGEYNASWTEADLVSTETGFDVPAFITSQAAPYWSGDINTRMGAMLEGYLDAASSDSILNIAHGTGAATDANDFGLGPRFDAAQQVLGDRLGEEGVLIVNSQTYAKMLQNDPSSLAQISVAGDTITTYAGLTVIVDDKVARNFSSGTVLGETVNYDNSKTVNVSYILAPGAIGYGVGTARVPLGIDRNELAFNGGGSSTITSRIRYGLSLNGVDWAGSGAPADLTALRTASNYDRKFDNKNVGIVGIIHN